MSRRFTSTSPNTAGNNKTLLQDTCYAIDTDNISINHPSSSFGVCTVVEEESPSQQHQQQPHLISIPIGSCSETSDSDTGAATTSGSRRIVKKKNSSNSNSSFIMNEVRQRRNYLMNSLSRWDSSSKGNNNSSSNQHSNAQQPSSSSTQQTSNNITRTFSQTLVISIASMCLVSLCTTMLWMFQVPHHNNSHTNNNNILHHLIPSYDTVTTSRSQSSLTSSIIRPPPMLSIGDGAKFYIDPTTSNEGSNRRLEMEVDSTQQQINSQYNTHPIPKVLTFRNIAQRGSTDHRIYTTTTGTNRIREEVVDSKTITTSTEHSGVDAAHKVNVEASITNEKTKQVIQQLLALPLTSESIDLNIETGRATRFPSVDERVRVYMSNWYLPPCPSTDSSHSNIDAFVEYNYRTDEQDGIEYMMFREVRTAREKKRGLLRTFIVDDTTDFDILRHLNPNNMMTCAKKSSYCKDFEKYLFPAMERIENTSSANSDHVLMYQFSDAEKTRGYNVGTGQVAGYPNVPNLKKFRYAISKEEREWILSTTSSSENGSNCVMSPRPIPITVLQQQMIDEGEKKVISTSQPIIMKLKIQRHYGYVQKIPALDMEWSQKKNQAIFRGQFTGRFPVGMDTNQIRELPTLEQCNLLHRCRLVYNAALHMKLIDAKLALPVLEVRKDFPQVINDVALYGDRVSIEDMLTYKAIIMLEGNDVSSGLKWALYSNSVVMTQTPTKTSWAMEELLEPWVHYVPLNDDLSDVEEKMQWIIDHDEEAQAIAYRGKLWIHDLVFHPDSTTDEAQIFDEIVRRTKAHYVRNPNMEVPSVNINVE